MKELTYGETEAEKKCKSEARVAIRQIQKMLAFADEGATDGVLLDVIYEIVKDIKC